MGMMSLFFYISHKTLTQLGGFSGWQKPINRYGWGMGMGYDKDENNVYYDGEIIEGADPETFKYLRLGYAKDKNNVYYDGKIIKGADPFYRFGKPRIFAKTFINF